MPRQLRKLDSYDFQLLNDPGYLPQGNEESEVLFTLIAERYERSSLSITSNLVFSDSNTSSPTPWPLPLPSTGWSTTPSSLSLTSPAAGLTQHSNAARLLQTQPTLPPAKEVKPAKLIDGNSARMVDAGHQVNAVLRDFMPRYHTQFAVPAELAKTAYPSVGQEAVPWSRVPLPQAPPQSGQGQHSQVPMAHPCNCCPAPERPSYAGVQVEILKHTDGRLQVRHEGEIIPSRTAPP